MTNFTHSFDVVISGAGMVGMSLAIGLSRSGLRVAVVEKTALVSHLDAEFDGRVSAVSYGSMQILENIGVWAGMAPYGEPILDIRVSDGAAPVFLHYDHREIGAELFGTIVENRHIRAALQNAAGQLESLVIIDNAQITSFETDDVGVTLKVSTGALLRARLLVAADGKYSPLRKMVGIGALEWNYKQTAIVCTIAHTLPHHGLAQERFLPAGPFAVLPMQNNHSSLVWVEPDDRVGLYLELPEDECIQEIRERVGDYLGDIRLASPRFSYPLSLMHANTYIGKRLALIGDAAHGMHPIAGQGVNLGFRDVAVLSKLILEKASLGLDIGSADVLAHYQRWRRFDNVAMLAATDGLNRLFSTNALPIAAARRLGLWAVGKLPPLKRFFMRDAMGITGDVP